MIKMDNEKLQNLWFSPNIISNQQKTNKTGGARRMHMGGGLKICVTFKPETLINKHEFADLSIDRRTMLKLISNINSAKA
jgi:hypothetical protein